MSGMEIVLAGAAGWSVLACTGGFAWSFAVTRLKRRKPQPEVVNWLPFLPPVPLSDKHWLDAWAPAHPAIHNLDVDAVRALLSEPQEQEQIDRRCREILAIEGLSS